MDTNVIVLQIGTICDIFDTIFTGKTNAISVFLLLVLRVKDDSDAVKMNGQNTELNV